MSKWTYLSPLLSVSLRLLQSNEMASWLRHVAHQPEQNAKRGARSTNGAVESPIDELLGALHLERRPSRAASMGNSLFWAGIGAALAAGALGATQVDRKQLRRWVGEVGQRVGGAASRSSRWVEHRALDEWLELLERVGLERRPSLPKRALRTAAWLGGGIVVGAGAVALATAYRARERSKGETATVEQVPSPSPDGTEASAAASDRPVAHAGNN